jgi:GNAT superfamily N-acetyltransferase
VTAQGGAVPDARIAVRRIRADEWQAVFELRLEATQDPAASIAFLETPDQVAARPEDFWRQRTENAATSETAAQFVAVVDDDMWVGSLSVLVRATGQTDHLGRFVDDRRADVVGVYVRPAHRGSGAIDLLLAAAADWVAGLGLTRLSLDVHRDNLRAQAAYRRAGFVPTGETFSSVIGPEIVMARAL